ncbi:MAG: hypothetical protein WAQ22_01780 [Candidatus Saccharimonas sp.]
MGRYIKQEESRSELQQRIAADLRAKANARSKEESSPKTVDGVEDSDYLKGTKATTTLDWVWLVIFLATIGVFVLFVVRVNS